jgi:hypothetical protein
MVRLDNPGARLRSRVITFVSATLLSLAAGEARADDPTDEYRIFDLAARRIAISHLTADQLAGATVEKVVISDAGSDKEVTGCKLKIDSAAVTSTASSDCPDLWAQQEPGTVKLTLKSSKYSGGLTLLRARPVRKAGKFAAPKSGLIVVTGATSGVKQAAVFVPGENKLGEWVTVAVKAGGQIEPDPSLWNRMVKADELRLAVLDANDVYSVIDLQKDTTGTPPPAPDMPYPELLPLKCDEELQAQKYEVGDSPVYCVDTTKDLKLQLVGLPRNQFVIRPNRTIYVVVRHWEHTEPNVIMTGTVGLNDAKLNVQTVAQSGTTEGEAPKHHKASVTIWPFAPRAVGQTPGVDVKLVKKSDPNVTLHELKFDLVVDTVYYAALRVGMAIGFGEFDHGYQAQKLGGGSLSEVVATASTTTNLEVVVGFVPYLDGLLSGRLTGRSYGGGLDLGFAPYLGVGVLGQGNKGIDAFKSFHGGLELEIGRSFSIALTFVGRFVNELPNNVKVGSPVPDGTLATHTGFAPGGALVLNMAPEFLKFAAAGFAK